jgi:hypothetical protein
MALPTMKENQKAWLAFEFANGRQQSNIAQQLNLSQVTICLVIREFCDDWSGHDVSNLHAYGNDRRPYAKLAVQNFCRSTGEQLDRPADGNHSPDYQYFHARHEHAWLLRAEGLTYEAIGERLGITSDRARQIVIRFGCKAKHACRNARFRIINGRQMQLQMIKWLAGGIIAQLEAGGREH